MTATDTLGLRERKRRATREAIERGALELVLEHGYENVTVEMICERAMISPRTFFNYAGSKERAVLGIDAPLPSDDLRAAYIAGMGGSPLADLLATLAAAFAESGGADKATLEKRRRILRDNPALAMKEFARFEEAEHSMVDLVRARVRADAPERRDDGSLDDEARMVVALTFGLVHYISRDMAPGGAPSAVTDALRRALALAHRVANG